MSEIKDNILPVDVGADYVVECMFLLPAILPDMSVSINIDTSTSSY